jgi:hypothetical protein
MRQRRTTEPTDAVMASVAAFAPRTQSYFQPTPYRWTVRKSSPPRRWSSQIHCAATCRKRLPVPHRSGLGLGPGQSLPNLLEDEPGGLTLNGACSRIGGGVLITRVEAGSA